MILVLIPKYCNTYSTYLTKRTMTGKSALCTYLCEHYGAALLDMNTLAADVREAEQKKHVDQVRDDAKVTFLNQIREQIQSAAQMVMESKIIEFIIQF